MILCIGNPQDSTKKPIQNSKVEGYKITIENLLHTTTLKLYTNNEILEKEMKKAVSFAVATKSIKYLGVNLTEHLKDLCTENDKVLLKDMEEDTQQWKIFRVYGWKNQRS